MFHAIILEAYIHFALMHTTDHIFPILPIKYPINEDGKLTIPYKLARSTKIVVPNLRVLLCLHVVWILHMLVKRRYI